ncbi:aspartic proteinase-like protein 2 [Hordeum vulgare]|nr:aspartic proteinase-like protein 2 [Hordeum vulgare]
MKPAAAVCVMAVAVLLAAASPAVGKQATAPEPAPTLMLQRTVPLSAARLEHIQKQGRARLAKRSGVPEFGLLRLPGVNFGQNPLCRPSAMPTFGLSVPMGKQSRRLRLKRASASPFVHPKRIYYTRVTLGNPPKQYSLQFDTGSNLMWLRCSPCTDCSMSGQLDAPLYSPSNSSTSTNISCSDDICKDAQKTGHSVCQASETASNQCGYSQAYADGTTTEGYYVSDIMRFDTVMESKNESATVSSAYVIFGCSNSILGPVPRDGFMGFGKDAPSVILQLNSQGVSPKAFSHCLTNSDEGGGFLVLGEVVEPGLVFTPLVPSQPRYSLNMKSIVVNGKKVHINSSLFTTSHTQGTFVDSGAPSFYLVDEVYDRLLKAVSSSCYIFFSLIHVLHFLKLSDKLFYLSTSNVSLLPVVTLYFEGGAPMTVGPKNYLVLEGYFDDLEMWCIAFQRSKDIEGYEHTTVLGDLVLRDKIFVYDLDKMRLGWVDYNCSLLNKTTLVVSVSGSMRRHALSYFSRLIAIGVALFNANIIALTRWLDGY